MNAAQLAALARREGRVGADGSLRVTAEELTAVEESAYQRGAVDAGRDRGDRSS